MSDSGPVRRCLVPWGNSGAQDDPNNEKYHALGLCVVEPGADPVPVDPQVTVYALSRRAFAFAPWAKPVLSMQPVGGTQLVTLPVYYQAGFMEAGIAPGEVMSFPPDQMAGFSVDIRARVVAYRYLYGDGSASPTTLSTGGVYPTGDVTHAYADAGDYQAALEVTYSADVSVDGSPFQPVYQTATVTSPAITVKVRTSHNILVP